jgi:hypothetical protein
MRQWLRTEGTQIVEHVHRANRDELVSIGSMRATRRAGSQLASSAAARPSSLE